MKEYLVPRDIQTRTEIFPGFGFAELGAVVVGGVVGAVLQLLPWFLPIPPGPKLFLRFFFVGLPVAAAYLLVRQDFGGGSLWKQLLAYRAWAGRRKVIYFRIIDKH